MVSFLLSRSEVQWEIHCFCCALKRGSERGHFAPAPGISRKGSSFPSLHVMLAWVLCSVLTQLRKFYTLFAEDFFYHDDLFNFVKCFCLFVNIITWFFFFSTDMINCINYCHIFNQPCMYEIASTWLLYIFFLYIAELNSLIFLLRIFGVYFWRILICSSPFL